MTKTILLADDDRIDASLLNLTLKAAGVTNRVLHVADGEAVLEYFKGEGRFSNRLAFPLPSILFLDLNMARLGGYGVLEWLQNRPEFKPLIIALTAFNAFSEAEKIYQFGAHSFIVKPAKPQDIYNLIEAFPQYWDSLPPIQGSSGPEIPVT